MTWNVRKSTPPDQTSTWDIMNPFIFHWTFTITTNETSTPLKIKMVHLNIMKSGKSSEPNLHDFGFKMWMLLILFNFQGRTPLFKIIPFSPCKFRMKQKNSAPRRRSPRPDGSRIRCHKDDEAPGPKKNEILKVTRGPWNYQTWHRTCQEA